MTDDIVNEPKHSPGKLVRDKIPDIIKAEGKVPAYRRATPEEIPQLLRLKLQEEVEEFLGAQKGEELGELVDILEVVLTISWHLKLSGSELEELRLAKRHDRGGFDQAYLWFGNQ